MLCVDKPEESLKIYLSVNLHKFGVVSYSHADSVALRSNHFLLVVYFTEVYIDETNFHEHCFAKFNSIEFDSIKLVPMDFVCQSNKFHRFLIDGNDFPGNHINVCSSTKSQQQIFSQGLSNACFVDYRGNLNFKSILRTSQ